MLESGSKYRIATLLLHPGARMLAVGVLVFTALAVFLPGVTKATLDTPQILSYQGRLTDAQKVTVPDGAQSMAFVIFDASGGGTCVWSAANTDANTATVDCGAPGTISVTVTDGLFNVLFGDTTGSIQNALPDSIFNTTSQRWLEIRVGGETLTPRRRLVSSATALQSGNSSLLDSFDTSQVGGSVAFVPVTDGTGNLTLTKNISIGGRIISAAHGANQGFKLPTNAGSPSAVAGTVEGDAVWDSTGNILYVYDGSAFSTVSNPNAFIQGGNSFGATATLGTNDVQTLAFETNNATRMTIDSSGVVAINAFTSNGGPLYTNASGTLAQATAGTSTQVLHGGATPSFSAVSLTSDVSGTLPVANGGTGITSFGTGIATFLGTPSSANLASALTDETGTGLAVFATAPTFTTSLTAPLVIGGTGASSSLTLRSTSGTGTSGADIIFQTGTNGGTEAMRILNSGNIGIGTTTPGSTLDIKGTLRFSGATSGFVGFVPAAAAGSTTYTLPNSDGTSGQVLSTNGSGTLSWATDTSGANTALSNLVTTSINQDLLPSADNTRDLGSTSLRWKTLHVGPGSVVVHNDVTDTAKLTLNFATGTGQLISDATTPIKITTGANVGLNIDTSGRVGIGEVAPSALLSVGSASPFQVDTAGNIIKIRNVDYTWPSSQAVSTNCLVNNGSGTLSWSACATGSGWSTGTGIVYTTSAGDKVGIGTSAPDSLLSVGASNQFQVDVNGNIVKINNVTTSFPVSQGAANSILQNDGSGGLTWTTTGAGVVTLQNAYTNSPVNEITLDTTRNEITIQNAAADAVPNFFLFKNAAGTQVARISSTGAFISGSGTTTYADGTLTTTSATYTINAAGNVDVQDALNADSITSDLGVSIAAGQSYTGAGAVTLSSAGGAGLTVQSASGTVTLGTSTALTASGALTVSSGGAGALSLDSATNTLFIAANDTTLQRTAAGTYAIDLNDGSATTLSLTNSGAGVASVSLAEAGSYTGAGAVTLSSGSGAGLTILGNAASTWSTSAGNLNLVAAGTGTANIQIGTGGAGSTTPDLLVTDVKSDAGDPTGVNGAMYYNASSGFFRCFEAGAWKNCDTTGGSTTLQSAYNSGATITTSGSTDIALTLTSGNFTASGAGSVNLTPSGASSFTSGAALTLTGGAASTWGTSSGNLTLSAAGSSTGNVQIGSGTASATPDLLVTDSKSTAGDPTAVDGAIYYNASSGLFRIAEGGVWKTICNKTDQACGSGTGSALSAISAATSGNSIDSGDNAQVWNWALTTAAKTAFTFGETTAATNGAGNQSLVDITTLSTSTASPLRVTSGGTANALINLASTGDFVIQDNGTAFAQFLDNGTVTIGKATAISTINLGVGTDIDTIHIGDGSSTDVITIGQASADVSITDAQWSISSAGAGSFSTLTTSSTINTNTFTATALTFSGASPNIAPSTAGTGITLNAATTGTVGIGGTSTGDILLGGGSGSTGCTVTNSTGAFTCSGAISTTATTGTQGWWSRSGTTLSPVNAGDAITTTGNISTTSSGTITSASTLTASNGLTLTMGALSLTGTSGSIALTGFGTTSITSTTTTGTIVAFTDTALTTGSLSNFTSTNNSAANAAWSADKFTITNAQGTTAVSTGFIAGVDVQFTQNTAVAGNNETALRVNLAANASASTDATVDSLLSIANNDTATGNQITVTDALQIAGANVTNGINLSGTFGTNLITATNFSVSQAGLITTTGGAAINSATGITTNQSSFPLVNTTATTVNFAGAATTLNIGNASGTTTIANATVNLSNGVLQTAGTTRLTNAGILQNITGFTQSSGVFTLTATSGAVALSGLSASSISTGANALTITSSNFNTTATGINSTAIGATTPSSGAFTTLSASSTFTANGALTVANGQTFTANGIANIGDGGDAIALSGTTISFTANGAGNDITANLVDNNTDALDIQQSTNNYININTTDAAENISFGNATTNPSYSFLGTGTATMAGSLTVNGSAITLGDAATDNVVFTADVNSNVIPNTDDAYDLGSITQRWRDLYLGPGSLNIGTSGNDYRMSFDIGGVGTLVFNENGDDTDLRIESDTEQNMFVVDASTNRVGIGTATPSAAFNVVGNSALDGAVVIDTATGGAGLSVQNTNNSLGVIIPSPTSAAFNKRLVLDQPNMSLTFELGISDSGIGGGIRRTGAADAGITNIFNNSGSSKAISFDTNSLERMRIDTNGLVGIGTSSPTSLLHGVGSQPTSVGTSPGTAATTAFTFVGGTGGNTTIATTGTGGVGAGYSFTAGAGGTAASATTASTGGAAGAISFVGGTGGAASVTGGVKVGGAGSTITFTAGNGGATSGTGTSNTGGAGGSIVLNVGSGGSASGATSNTAGAMGKVNVVGTTPDSNSPLLQVTNNTDFASSAVFGTTGLRFWQIGQNRPPDATGVLDAFFINDRGTSLSGNGNTRFIINTAGNVGIGDTSPAALFTVGSGDLFQVSSTGVISTTSTSQTVLSIAGSNTGGTWFNLINTDTGADDWNIIVSATGNGEGAGDLLFRNGTDGAVRLDLDAGGNVGVGTGTTPVAQLTVIGDGTSVVQLGSVSGLTGYAGITLGQTAAATSTNYNFLSGPGDQNLYINRPTSQSIHFRENNVTKVEMNAGGGLTIDYGNENIGTVADALTFGFASGEGIASKRDAGGNQYGLDFYTASGNRMSITNGGLVGIGTTAPDNTLHVFKGSAGSVSGDGNAALVVENSTNAYIHVLTPAANEQGILFGDPTLSVSGAVIVTSGNDMQFRSGGNTTRMTLDSGGNLSVSPTTTTGNGLSISDTSLTTGKLSLFTSTNNSASGSAWIANLFNVTNGQTTSSANTSGLQVDWNQVTGAAVNTSENVFRVRIAPNASSANDATVDSLIELRNDDTATGNQITGSFGMTIVGSNITHGINFNGAPGTNYLRTTAGTFKVDASGNVFPTLSSASLNGVCHSSAGTATQDQLLDCSGTPSDYAEWYETTNVESAGDIVVAGPTTITYSEDLYDPMTGLPTGSSASYTAAVATKATSAYQTNLLGVVSTSPHSIIGESVKNAASYPKPVALTGRVPVKVNVENGSIAVGDPITSSSTAGVGMKATKPGMIVGRALEAWAGPGQGTVMVFVNAQYWVGSTITSDGVLTYIGDSATWKSSGTATAGTQGYDSNAIVMRGSGWDGAAAQDVDFTFKNVVTNAATAKLALYNDTGSEVASINQAGDLAISGKFYPSDSGVMQTSKYIYYDSTGPSDYMRTNAAGWSTGSYDFAELFPSLDTSLVPGELVAFDPLNPEHILRARAETSSLLMGIVSTRPGFLAGEWKPGRFQIALAGRVPTRVSVESGAIKIGDPLTVSATLPGVAMKAVDGNIVGYALEDTVNNGTISVYVKSAYIAPKNVASQTPPSTFQALDVYGILNVHGNMITEVSGIMGAAWKWEINADGMLIQHVDTPNGKKDLYTSGSAQATILLFGHAKLVNGVAMIALDTVDPGFTSVINPDAPMFVTVTPTSSETNGLYVKVKSATGFVVADRLESTTMQTEFDWTLVAYRKGYGEAVVAPVVETTVPTAPAETTTLTAPAETTTWTAPAETTTPTAPAEVIVPTSPTTDPTPAPDPAPVATTEPMAPAEVIGAAPADTTTPTEPATTTQQLVSEPAPLAP